MRPRDSVLYIAFGAAMSTAKLQHASRRTFSAVEFEAVDCPSNTTAPQRALQHVFNTLLHG